MEPDFITLVNDIQIMGSSKLSNKHHFLLRSRVIAEQINF